MAQFRATIEGQRGMASRLGSKSSGITARINGWEQGITVDASHRDGVDRFQVFLNGGSNGSRSRLIFDTADLPD